MQRWWNKELAFLQFTKSPWWRFIIWGIALTIIAYCVTDYFVRRYDTNRILPYNSSKQKKAAFEHSRQPFSLPFWGISLLLNSTSCSIGIPRSPARFLLS